MVSDYLEHSTGGGTAAGACIGCWTATGMPDHGPGTRITCRACGEHLVCRAVDIEANHIPGHVRPRPEGVKP
jgi:hypothetical protein